MKTVIERRHELLALGSNEPDISSEKNLGECERNNSKPNCKETQDTRSKSITEEQQIIIEREDAPPTNTNPSLKDCLSVEKYKSGVHVRSKNKGDIFYLFFLTFIASCYIPIRTTFHGVTISGRYYLHRT